MTDMKRLHALIEETNFDWLIEYSDQNGISLAETVRRAISGFRYSESKRENLSESQRSELPFLVDGPTEDEDSLEGLQKRMMNIELAFFNFYASSKDPSSIPSSVIYEFVPDYMKL